MKKKFLIICLCFFIPFNVFAAILEGHVENAEQKSKYNSELYTGSIVKLKKNNYIKMSVLQNLDSDLSKENEEFFATVSEDIMGCDGIIIPKGTLAHGKIKKIIKAKSFSRDGEIQLYFDNLTTPDGREIPIKGDMTTKLHLIKEASKTLKTNAVYATAGAMAGGLVSLGLFGVDGAVASHGATIGGGAAVGSAIGIGLLMTKKGDSVLIANNDEIKVKINSDAEFPIYKNTAFLQDESFFNGLNVKIKDITFKTNSFGKTDIITLNINVSNATNTTFSIFDIILIDNFNTKYFSNVFEYENLRNLKILPNDKTNLEIEYSVSNIQKDFWLIFVDNKTQKIMAKISLENASKNLSPTKNKINKKLLEFKKDFYREDLPFTN